MKNIDFLTIRAFAEENIDFFIGARVQKIQQPTRRDFVFSLRNNGESRKLYININPQFYHLAFASDENLKRRGVVIPQKPPMFCMLLRKYLEGVKISDILAVEGERVFELHFDIIDELSQTRSLCLAIELMGKHSNVILYDRETSVIIGCAHNVGAEKSRYRELQGGMKYIYPPLVNNSEVGGKYGGKYRITEQGFAPAELDDYFTEIQAGVNLKSEKEKLLKIVSAKKKKVKTSSDKISALLSKRDNTEKYRLYGELLTSNIHLHKDYSKEIELFDYMNNKNILIELDETKTMSENAQRYFKLYTKSKTTKEKSEKMLEGLKVEAHYLDELIYSVEKAESVEDLDEIKQELGLQETSRKDKKQINIEKREINGFTVYIGKNNKQNDYIVSKLAKDEDYWFHVKSCAGSHVLMKVNEKEPDEGTIFECCKLAREYSSAKMPSKVGVIFTKRKFVKKPPESPLGYVIYKNEKEVLV